MFVGNQFIGLGIKIDVIKAIELFWLFAVRNTLYELPLPSENGDTPLIKVVHNIDVFGSGNDFANLP